MNEARVVYHSADMDGIFSREVARRFLCHAYDSITYIGWNFGDPPLNDDLLRGWLYVMDLPLDRPFGLEFKDGWLCKNGEPIQPIDRWASNKIVWIDHHKSAIESHPDDIPGYRIDGVAACRLAWQWFSTWSQMKGGELPGPEGLPDLLYFKDRRVVEPLAIRLAGEYDIWDKRDPRAQCFQYGLRSQELRDSDFLGMLCDCSPHNQVVSDLLVQGEYCMNYAKRTDASTCQHRSFLIEWEGLKWLAINSARFNSQFFEVRDVPETGHDALLGFCWDGRQWQFSLYHAAHRTDLDLSAIAKKYGGGGHRGACGFTAKTLPLTL